MRNAVIRGKLKVVRVRETDRHTSDIGHYLAMTQGQEVRPLSGGPMLTSAPTDIFLFSKESLWLF